MRILLGAQSDSTAWLFDSRSATRYSHHALSENLTFPFSPAAALETSKVVSSKRAAVGVRLSDAEKQARYRARNREKILWRAKLWRKNNPEVANAQARASYLRRRDRVLEKNKTLKDYKHQHYLKHKEKYNKRACEYAKANMPKILAQGKIRRAKLRAERLEKEKALGPKIVKSQKEKNREYQFANREKIALRAKKWWKANRERKAFYAHKRRALKMGTSVGDRSAIVSWETRWRSKREVVCYWCRGKFLPKECHSDHIISLVRGGAHSVENLCISCSVCNFRKNASDPKTWNATLAQPALIL